MNTNEQYMQRCLQLARFGHGKVAPNPLVGCVIVSNGMVVGEGYHEYFGGPHAEVNAINAVLRGYSAATLQNSTLYVNLEPCSHHGKTPPCVDLIIAKGIPRVVIGSYDPNPLVAGIGIEKLISLGVEVTTEVLRAESDHLNRRFITFHTQKRPYIILKWVKSTDGFMALNEPRQFWMSGPEAKKLSHQWRSEEQAIMVGKNTVLIDNPLLTVRETTGNNPLRITVDRRLELQETLSIFNADAPTLIFNELETRKDENIEYLQINFEKDIEQQVLDELYNRNILSVIVEGGPTLLNSFIEKNLWDEAQVFVTPHILSEGKDAPLLQGEAIETRAVGNDTLTVFANPKKN